MTEAYRDFACGCGEENAAECEADYEKVRKAIGLTVENFCTGVIASLWWDFQVSIESIHYDQWGSIFTERYHDGDKEGKPQEKAYIQFDKFEHGLALTWLHWADVYGWPDYTQKDGDE